MAMQVFNTSAPRCSTVATYSQAKSQAAKFKYGRARNVPRSTVKRCIRVSKSEERDNDGDAVEYIKPPKTKRGEETLRRICEAAERLFAEKGYYATEVNDITRSAGISSGTFYIYFSDKISIFRYLMEELSRELRKELREAKEEHSSNSLLESEGVSIRTFFQFVSKHIGLFAIVWQSQFVDPKSFKKYYERFSVGYITEIRNAQEEGEIRLFDPACISYCLMGIYNFTALKSFIFDGKEPDEEMIEQLLNFIRNGLQK
ncbi:MAG: TetR/AcrR family transcriptional regulator [Synergistaceae bacterium]|jgi:AcrR family transcriptional regulator|nr:TetR/AcrR family transcriptional regulator [Synergistaceae bacterium]